MPSSRNECSVYVGNIPTSIKSKEIEDLFHRFGKISWVDLKNRNGPPFAFVEFEDPRDADDAVAEMDGYNYDNYRIRVQFPRRERGAPGRSRSRDGGSSSGSSHGGKGGRRGTPARRTEYRVSVSGLPRSGSWQDLKDHMRKAGDVCFADVYKDGSAIVEFLRYEDMKYAIRELDDSKFCSHEGESSYIRVKEDKEIPPAGGGGRSRSNSYSPRGRRRDSNSDSSRRSRTRSVSRSRSSRSRSPYDRR